ncbi:MAG: o-succinylbenzoate--CoA ligase [Chloroflexi bacterium]|nr:o-succinylbenzoate--CoA ligase [Chloroflexota bacterium]
MARRKVRLNQRPEKTYIAHGEFGLSFAQTSRKAAQTCAAILRHTALAPGDRVAILLATPAPFILTLLALMRLRAVSVPLNRRLQPSELAWQVKNADCRLLICEPKTRSLSVAVGVDVMEMPNIEREAPASAYGDFGALNLEDDFAIIHTSGTSGRPKAAILTYGNIYQSAVASALRLGTIQSERWLCVLPLYHVGGLSIVTRSLLYGTAVEVMPPGAFDAREVNRILSDHPITLVSLAPTMLQRLLDVKTRRWNPRLRLILLGGEAPAAELVERCIAEELPIAASYGLTETASQVATAMPELVYRKPSTVGKALRFTRTRIVDESGGALGAHEPGEILVKGGVVTRGYYGEPEATRRALLGGWLHTGDIGYRDEDGDLFVLQRRADLIVSGGENIYPAEVERVLRQHADVAQAIVFGLPDRKWGQCVAALLECRAGAQATPNEITDFARGQLASYKLPRQIAFVEALPRTASGKIQRRDARQIFDDAISRQQ